MRYNGRGLKTGGNAVMTPNDLERENQLLRERLAQCAIIEEELRRNQLFLYSILENIPDMIFVKDAKDLRFIRFNRAGERLIGTPVHELIGKNDYDFFPKAEADFFTSKDRDVLNSKTLLEIDEEPIHTKKGVRYLHTKKIPILDEVGNPRYLLGISEDITDRKQTAESLGRAYDELKAANHELEAFSYSVSHDLRAPLRAIEGFSEILLEDHAGQLDAEASRLLAIVRRNALRMSQLIDDLLAFSRLGRQELGCQSIDMQALAHTALGNLRQQEPERKVEVKIHPLTSAVGDNAMMRQVWTNLLSNALKFTRHRPSPIVEVGCRNSSEEMTYFIKDNGVGFDMRYADKLFGVFQRLHSVDEFEGTGVGLAIVQRIIRRHGGRVWAESEPGTGSSFYFTLPMRK